MILPELYRLCANQLETDGATSFLHNDLTFIIFLNSHREYEYDILDGTDSVDGGINQSYSAQQTVECILEDY